MSKIYDDFSYTDVLSAEYISKRDAMNAILDTDVKLTSFRIGQCILTEYFKTCRRVLADTVEGIDRADVEAVRHARWETIKTNSNGGVVRRCSWCKTERVNAPKSPWCRDCGAKMDIPEVDLRMESVWNKLGSDDPYVDDLHEHSGLLEED